MSNTDSTTVTPTVPDRAHRGRRGSGGDGMSVPTFELTETEAACGVTLADVTRVAARSAVLGRGRDRRACMPVGTPPALASAAARLKLGAPAEFVGISKEFGFPIYRLS